MPGFGSQKDLSYTLIENFGAQIMRIYFIFQNVRKFAKWHPIFLLPQFGCFYLVLFSLCFFQVYVSFYFYHFSCAIVILNSVIWFILTCFCLLLISGGLIILRWRWSQIYPTVTSDRWLPVQGWVALAKWCLLIWLLVQILFNYLYAGFAFLEMCNVALGPSLGG